MTSIFIFSYQTQTDWYSDIQITVRIKIVIQFSNQLSSTL